MKPLSWTPTAEEIEDARDVLKWARAEMMNEITPRFGMAQMAMLEDDDGAEAEYDELLFMEGAYNAADTLGQTMIGKAWRRHLERMEGA